jgi:hypothetical protein
MENVWKLAIAVIASVISLLAQKGNALLLPHDVWRSVEYEETIYEVGDPLTILDVRGLFANGNRWRYLGRFGDSASYSDVDEATAKLLDQVLDGACLPSAPRR